MKKHLNIFTVVLLSVFTISFSSCSKDDEPSSNGNNIFSFNGETFYLHYDFDWSWPTLDYSKRENILQLNFSLSKSPSAFDIDNTNSVGGSIEFTPFKPNELKKGDSIEILSRQVGRYATYTCISSDFKGVTGSQVLIKNYYIYNSGSITFEGYDFSSEIVTLKFNKVTFNGDNNDTCILDGVMKCVYDENGYLTLHDGIYD